MLKLAYLLKQRHIQIHVHLYLRLKISHAVDVKWESNYRNLN